MEKTKINYVSKYHRELGKAESITSFIKDGVVVKSDKMPELNKSQRKVTRLKNELRILEEQVRDVTLEVYSPELEYVVNSTFFAYTNKTTGTDYLYDINGDVCSPSDYQDSTLDLKSKETLQTKTSEVTRLLGFNLSRGLVVFGHFIARIAGNNRKVNLQLTSYIIVNAFSVREKFTLDVNGEVDELFTNQSEHRLFKSFHVGILAGFYKRFYSVDYIPIVDASKIAGLVSDPNFELVVKTAPKWFIDVFFSEHKFQNLEKVNHIHKLLGVSKAVYTKYKDAPSHLAMVATLYKANVGEQETHEIISVVEVMARDFVLFGKHLATGYDRYSKWASEDFYSLRTAILDETELRLACNQWDVFHRLVSYYYDKSAGARFLKPYYTIMSFLQYARDAIIDQGFTNIDNFVGQLIDYLRYNLEDQASPVVKPDYLRRVHDVYAANRKITVSDEMNTQFMAKYETSNKWTKIPNVELGEIEEDIKYTITYPSHAKDLKTEGNILNHCVGGYIPRVIAGELLIYFLRKRDYPGEPFITVEVRSGKITQVKGVTNRDANAEVKEYLRDWAAATGLTPYRR